jgi:TonB family protein
MLLIRITTALFFMMSVLLSSAQGVRSASKVVEILDPETLVSFTGLEGKGFLGRSSQNLPQPYYTGKETGVVALIFTIKPSGHVANVRVEKSNLYPCTTEMADAARVAVENWKFQPLSTKVRQNDEEVRVVIQFNHTGSNILYSHDGRYTIEGLGSRYPVALPSPDYHILDEGVVNVILTLNPDGTVAWIDRFYGAYPHLPAPPRLGMITNEAVRKWTFNALPADQPQEDLQIKVTFRYIRWSGGE